MMEAISKMRTIVHIDAMKSLLTSILLIAAVLTSHAETRSRDEVAEQKRLAEIREQYHVYRFPDRTIVYGGVDPVPDLTALREDLMDEPMAGVQMYGLYYITIIIRDSEVSKADQASIKAAVDPLKVEDFPESIESSFRSVIRGVRAMAVYRYHVSDVARRKEMHLYVSGERTGWMTAFDTCYELISRDGDTVLKEKVAWFAEHKPSPKFSKWATVIPILDRIDTAADPAEKAMILKAAIEADVRGESGAVYAYMRYVLLREPTLGTPILERLANMPEASDEVKHAAAWTLAQIALRKQTLRGSASP